MTTGRYLAATIALAVLRSAAALGSEIMVDDDGLQCFAAPYATISGAIAAAKPGDEIVVCPGTYAEQVVIDKHVKVTGRPINGETAIIRPTALPESRPSLLSTNPVTAAVIVDGVSFQLESLVVDLSASSVTGCMPVLTGVYVRNGKGSVRALSIDNVRVPAKPGCDTGVGLFIEGDTAARSRVVVSDLFASNYQKGAVVVSGPETSVNVLRTVASGDGPVTAPVQNGIQVGLGATARIRDSFLSRHGHVGTDKRAAGVLLYLSEKSLLSRNTIGEGQTAVFSIGSKNRMKGGTYSSLTDEGVIVFGDGNKIRATSVVSSGGAGVFINGSGNLAFGGLISDTPIGLWFFAGEGNRERSIDFQNVLEPVRSGGSATLTTDAADPFTALCSSNLDCDDGNACTADTCTVGVGTCSYLPASDGSPCSDSNSCTTGDVCVLGLCAGAAVANGTPCDDGAFCSINDICNTGQCIGASRDCSDVNACTDDVCDETHNVCSHFGIPGCRTCSTVLQCSDANPCTTDACVGGTCGYTPTSCSDGNSCTTDSCSPVVGCQSTQSPDGTPCDIGMTCASGVCQ